MFTQQPPPLGCVGLRPLTARPGTSLIGVGNPASVIVNGLTGTSIDHHGIDQHDHASYRTAYDHCQTQHDQYDMTADKFYPATPTRTA